MNSEDKFNYYLRAEKKTIRAARWFILGWIIWALLYLSVLVAFTWAVIHFVAKYW